MAEGKPAGGAGKERLTVWINRHTLDRLRTTAKARNQTQAEIAEAALQRELDAPTMEALAATVTRLVETVDALRAEVAELRRRLPPEE